MHPDVHAFFDEATNTITYLLREPNGRACAVIDSVLDFDYASGCTDTRSADAVIAYVRAQDLDLQWVLETHVHADHLSAAPISKRLWAVRLALATASPWCRKPSARCSTRAPALPATAASLIGCFAMATV